MPRPPWREYFLDLAQAASTRATCPRAHVGAVIVKDNNVLATGYNGAPPGAPHCVDVGCEIEDEHCIRTTHAEVNAVAQAARHGVSIEGANIYIYDLEYPGGGACRRCRNILRCAGINLIFCASTTHIETKEAFNE